MFVSRPLGVIVERHTGHRSLVGLSVLAAWMVGCWRPQKMADRSFQLWYAGKSRSEELGRPK